MKPVLQTRFGEPEGNCFQACVASILERELEDVPDLIFKPEERNWVCWFNENLIGASVCIISVEGRPLDGYIPRGSYFIACGPCAQGPLHCVVMRSGTGEDGEDEFVHDPHPGTGIEKCKTICLVLWEPSSPVTVDEILLRITDPGRYLPRGDKYTEPRDRWYARAILDLFESVRRGKRR